MVVFRSAVVWAVAAFWQIPNHGLAVVAQLTFKSLVFSGTGPIKKRTISFSDSGVPQASTKMLSISKHCALLFLGVMNVIVSATITSI